MQTQQQPPNPLPIPSEHVVSEATAVFVNKDMAEQGKILAAEWQTAPAADLRAFAAGAHLAADHARHDWEVFTRLFSALAVALGLLAVGVDPTKGLEVAGLVAVGGLAVLLLWVRLMSIRNTQLDEVHAASWLAARGLS